MFFWIATLLYFFYYVFAGGMVFGLWHLGTLSFDDSVGDAVLAYSFGGIHLAIAAASIAAMTLHLKQHASSEKFWLATLGVAAAFELVTTLPVVDFNNLPMLAWPVITVWLFARTWLVSRKTKSQ